MAANASSLSAPWSDRIKRAGIILLVTALVLGGLVILTDLTLARAIFAFVCIAAAALVPWQLHDSANTRDIEPRADPVDAAVVRSLMAGLPDPSVLLDRAGRVLHFNPAAEELAPALRRGELAQSALRSPEIIATLRQAIATNRPQRANYVERVPIDRWMELVVTPIPVPTSFGGARHLHADDVPRPDAAAAGGGNARRFRRQCQPRAAHAARGAVRLHRHAAGTGEGRCRRRASASSASCARRQPAWRG